MSTLIARFRPNILIYPGLLLMAALAGVLVAQIEGERGVPPIASSGDYEVSGIKVDTAGKTPQEAREAGWRLAQRLGWQKLWAKMNGGAAPGLSDSQLDAIVSGIEVESEQIGPHRYIATLGIQFDRARAGQILGVSGSGLRSPPLLVLPVLWQGGAPVSFESVNEWQKAWARYRTGDSAIDYVRTSGTGPDSLLLNYGQTGRRGRTWWRVLLDQYGAADVIMPIARVERMWPGGAVEGHFTARYGPDNRYIGDFRLRASDAKGIPAMMDEAVRRIDALYVQALSEGALRPDPSLIIEEPVNATNVTQPLPLNMSDVMPEEVTPAATVATFQIQYDSANPAAVAQAEGAVRAVPGVRNAATTSLALGGTSVMAVTFDGSAEMLRTALMARGYTVSAAGTTMRIVRRAAQ